MEATSNKHDGYKPIERYSMTVSTDKPAKCILKDSKDVDVQFEFILQNDEEGKAAIKFELESPDHMKVYLLNFDTNKVVKNKGKILLGSYQKNKRLFMDIIVFPVKGEERPLFVSFYSKSNEENNGDNK